MHIGAGILSTDGDFTHLARHVSLKLTQVQAPQVAFKQAPWSRPRQRCGWMSSLWLVSCEALVLRKG